MQTRTRKEFIRDLWIGGIGVIFAHLIFIVMILLAVFIGGCATTMAQQPEQIRTQETLRGLVRIGQMGMDCAESESALLQKELVKSYFVSQGLPGPSIVKLMPLAGSSFCGFAQGTASEATMLALGSRNIVVAEAEVFWEGITEKELLRAHTLLASMRPRP